MRPARARMTSRATALVIVATATVACGPRRPASFGPDKVDIPVSDGTRARAVSAERSSRQSAPPSGAAKASHFPPVVYLKLGNGMGVDVVTSRALPIVQMRLLVRAGASDAPPGVALLTGEMLKDGGTRGMTSAELARRIETLGADLSVDTALDGTILSMAVTRDQAAEGLALLAQIVREPRFDDGELRKTKARAVDAAESALRSSGQFTATRLLFRELYPAKSAYATYGAVPSEINRIDAGAVRELHRRFYVPKATTLVLAGDIDEATAKGLAEKSFGSWTGGEPPKTEHAPPRLTKTRVLVAHRPKSAQSDVYVAVIAPPRQAPEWANVRVAVQILGGGPASRLYADVREQRSLAYRVSAQVQDLAHGEQPLFLYAGTATPKTALTVAALLENLTRLTTSPPATAETENARRFVSDVFAIRMETIGSIADLVVTQEQLGLGEGYWDKYRRDVRATDAAAAETAARKLVGRGDTLVVVAGDADIIAPELAKIGEVTVVDPEKELETMRTIPQEAR